MIHKEGNDFRRSFSWHKLSCQRIDINAIYFLWIIFYISTTVRILYAVRLLAAFLPSNNSETISTSGNMLPDSIPDCRLSPACWETAPTRLGPNAPPKSPAMARKANKAVPPRGRRGEVMLIVPGHMIATENPQKTQPIRPRTGLEDRDASR